MLYARANPHPSTLHRTTATHNTIQCTHTRSSQWDRRAAFAISSLVTKALFVRLGIPLPFFWFICILMNFDLLFLFSLSSLDVQFILAFLQRCHFVHDCQKTKDLGFHPEPVITRQILKVLRGNWFYDQDLGQAGSFLFVRLPLFILCIRFLLKKMSITFIHIRIYYIYAHFLL